MEHHLERRLWAFEQDRRSGAAELARQAVVILAAARARGTDAATLNRLRHRLVRAHPTMAAVWNASHAAEPREFLKAIALAWRRAARNARRLLPSSGTVVTLSYSSTVVAALERRRGQVIVAESLPGGEGERTARALRRRGTRAVVVPDATLAGWVAAAAAVVIGADAITPRGVINKVGSRLLALAAKVERCPCFVVADTSKLAFPPSRFPLPRLGPGDLFEYTELGLITRVVTERGALNVARFASR